MIPAQFICEIIEVIVEVTAVTLREAGMARVSCDGLLSLGRALPNVAQLARLIKGPRRGKSFLNPG